MLYLGGKFSAVSLPIAFCVGGAAYNVFLPCGSEAFKGGHRIACSCAEGEFCGSIGGVAQDRDCISLTPGRKGVGAYLGLGRERMDGDEGNILLRLHFGVLLMAGEQREHDK